MVLCVVGLFPLLMSSFESPLPDHHLRSFIAIPLSITITLPLTSTKFLLPFPFLYFILLSLSASPFLLVIFPLHPPVHCIMCPFDYSCISPNPFLCPSPSHCYIRPPTCCCHLLSFTPFTRRLLYNSLIYRILCCFYYKYCTFSVSGP